MRLLKKSEVSQAQAIDKAREVQEGMKLSRRVDDLRKLQAQEEQSLEKWRTETLSAIGEEIKVLEGKKEDIKIELIYLKEELSRESLLTRKERLHLEDLKTSLDEQKKFLDERQNELSLYEIDIVEALKNAKDTAARGATYEDIAKNLQEKAQEKFDESQNVLKNAKMVEQRTLKAQQDAENDFILRTNDLKTKEHAVFQKERENNFLRSELDKEKIQLADQRATLERALNRLKNTRHG